MTALLVVVCAAWFGAGILIGFGISRGQIRKATRRMGSVRESSQLEVTNVHHVPTRECPVDRPRVKKPGEE